VHPLWFYKHQRDNRLRPKLFVACQWWWFQWRFRIVPSVPGYLRKEEEHKPNPWRNTIERNHRGLHLENEVAVVKTPTIISNNPVQQLTVTQLRNNSPSMKFVNHYNVRSSRPPYPMMRQMNPTHTLKSSWKSIQTAKTPFNIRVFQVRSPLHVGDNSKLISFSWVPLTSI